MIGWVLGYFVSLCIGGSLAGRDGMMVLGVLYCVVTIVVLRRRGQ